MFCIQAPRWWCPLSFHPPPYPHPKSFIAYPTLPTTCYTIPEDTQRGNLCPGIAPNLRNSKPATQISVYKECTMRSRLHQISISRNFIIYGQWAPFPTHRRILRRRSRVNACRFAIARDSFSKRAPRPSPRITRAIVTFRGQRFGQLRQDSVAVVNRPIATTIIGEIKDSRNPKSNIF